MKLTKKQRQSRLIETVESRPFMTDESLAEFFGVSVQTIRLDRMELSIPEVRERIKNVAQKQFDEVKALEEDEIIGEVVDLKLDHNAISILDIRSEHVFERTKIARGHHLFAQANSLAVAVINDQLALTAKSSLYFTRQVKEGERVIAKAQVKKTEQERTLVEVNSYVGDEKVFTGKFTMYRSPMEGGSSRENSH